jgi:hypothetical protein
MNGARSAEWYRRIYRDASISYSFLAATDYTTANSKITAKTGHTIFVQKITLAVTTDNAAIQTFQDSAGTPIILAATKASPGAGPITWDFGARGIALTEAKDFQHKMSAAGMAGHVSVEAYQRQTSALSQASAASA